MHLSISSAWRTSLVVLGTLFVLILASLLSLYVGARDISLIQILGDLWNPGSGVDSIVVHSLRWPRLMAALIVGVSLAVAGALMQGLTNNPMASPSILGINGGASLGLALAMLLVPQASFNTTIVFPSLGLLWQRRVFFF